MTPIDMLRHSDTTDDTGQRVVSSYRFTTLDLSRPNEPSKHRFVPRARRTGAKHDLRKHNQICIQPLDEAGERDGHPIPVHIDLIEQYNGEDVI
jgi:hypothetical protein